MAQAIAQTKTVYAGQSSQLTVVEVHGDAYKWELYKEVTGVNFAVVPGNCPSKDAFFTGGINIGSSVNVTWITPGIYFFKVTVFQAGCTMNLKVGKMIVMKSLFPATISQPAPVCMGETADIIITLSGTAPWSIDVSDGTDPDIATFVFNLSNAYLHWKPCPVFSEPSRFIRSHSTSSYLFCHELSGLRSNSHGHNLFP